MDEFLTTKLSDQAGETLVTTFLFISSVTDGIPVVRLTPSSSTSGWMWPFRQIQLCARLSVCEFIFKPIFRKKNHLACLRNYITVNDVGMTGPAHIRPMHLPHRQDFGLRGTSDHVLLWQIVLSFFFGFSMPVQNLVENIWQLILSAQPVW